MFERTARDRRRPLSAKPAAIRQREDIAPDAVVSMQLMNRKLDELIDWWPNSWTNLQRRNKSQVTLKVPPS
jgi:lauroyl/myristoyl acyltransferase